MPYLVFTDSNLGKGSTCKTGGGVSAYTRMSCSRSGHLCFLQGVDMSANVRRGGGAARFCRAGEMSALGWGRRGESPIDLMTSKKLGPMLRKPKY